MTPTSSEQNRLSVRLLPTSPVMYNRLKDLTCGSGGSCLYHSECTSGDPVGVHLDRLRGEGAVYSGVGEYRSLERSTVPLSTGLRCRNIISVTKINQTIQRNVLRLLCRILVYLPLFLCSHQPLVNLHSNREVECLRLLVVVGSRVPSSDGRFRNNDNNKTSDGVAEVNDTVVR